MSDLLWTPDPERVAATRLTQFSRLAAQRHGVAAGDYAALHRWSVEQRSQFWQLVWDYTGIRATRAADDVLVDGDRMPGARWFPGAELNFAANLLRSRDDGPALIARNESGARRVLSRAGLYDEVATVAAALRAMGVVRGDRVAGLLPNVPEAVIAMLATAAIGAIWSSGSPDFGVSAIVDRFGQIGPKVLFTVNGYRYGGKRHALDERLPALARALPTVERIVVVDDGAGAVPVLPNLLAWAALADLADATGIEFAALPFDHPLFVLYSSGTTGRPKCIVHGAGGTLLQHLKEHRLHTDLGAGDVLFYYTTCGWMMWNWLVSGLASEATVVLFDGIPLTADRPALLWDIADEEGISVFGTSAKYLQAAEKAGVRACRSHHLGRLRAILSTGSPLLPAQYDYVYDGIKSDVHLASISGGTDIVSCFVLGNPAAPVYRGEIQCAGLGMDVRIFDDDGRARERGTGELVCTRAFPSMPVGFWDDPDGSRYRQAYFDRFPGVWAHGDYAERTVHGGFVIHGRSDAVLNPGGVRIGTAEIYRQVETIPEIAESVVVGQSWEDDVRVVLFVRLRDGAELDERLRRRICDTLRSHASPRHVPARIIAVTDIPRTMSGKIVELAVREVIHGRPVKNRDALANPQALAQFADLPELNE
ncbi:MAG: acetoacetate--CoA ligase [Gammaproteobacteria bacterium]|nr:acetoacetate--CoA ligase [Gammaproteobacteria bacterium]